MRLARLLQLLLLTLPLTACKGLHPSREIDLIPLFSTDMPSLCLHAGMDEAVDDAGLHVRFNGPPDGDTQRQIDIVAEAIARNVYGIAITPPRLYSANGVVRQAASRGIPTVVLMHPALFPPQQHLSFVVEDLAVAAQLAAARVQAVTPPHTHILIAGIDTISSGSQDRFTAVDSALKQTVPQDTVTVRITNSSGNRAFVSELVKALSEDSSINAIIALDSHAAYWIALTVHRANAGNRIKVIAFDQSVEVLAALRHGDVDSVIAQDLRTTGRLAISNMQRDRHQLPVPTITRVAPLLVTREDIDSDATQRVLLLNWMRP
ncbi:MAG: substrate-binding domain-containing protein [Edaphobacter sp.]|uniref:sugar ABC transporter substrate-binding protein n=1 Tax=Edaphobacter sp. TaxID=1934404 RepID=UPI0023A1C999|nr:substrate-binding domain-containing protein [Edaphobacter sp.]MDE1177934.1 substrate-binding domain-containing protein [Edaphobacter sp.]